MNEKTTNVLKNTPRDKRCLFKTTGKDYDSVCPLCKQKLEENEGRRKRLDGKISEVTHPHKNCRDTTAERGSK